MHALDLVILVVYLAGTVGLGAWFSRSQKDVRDYFVSGQQVPWWAITGSIVATETSTVTFISVPGFAYGANLTFLQLVAGYLIGRVAVSILFIPAYFRGELLTVYQLLGDRFGTPVKRFASGLFLVTRSLADGFRLYLTGLVLAALLMAMPDVRGFAAGWLGDDPALGILVLSMIIMGVATIVYTFLGGMTAVIWTDVIQLVVYVAGAIVAAAVLLTLIPGGWPEVVRVGTAHDKFRLTDFTLAIGRDYTFWSGVIGGAFLTTATHGTDQLMVQRYLCSSSARQARVALLSSGAIILAQFILFLLIGVMLFVFYRGPGAGETAAFTLNGQIQADRIFPQYIVTHLPPGLVGLVIAAIFAAAMSTLSSSLNSSSAAAIADFYVPATANRRTPEHYLRASKLMTVVWGLVQMTVAMVAIAISRSVVNEVLAIASFTNGVILGVFFLGTFTSRVGQGAAFAGIAVGTAVMTTVWAVGGVSWQWYTLIGSLTTLAAGAAAGAFEARR
jgi:SSS family transporter